MKGLLAIFAWICLIEAGWSVQHPDSLFKDGKAKVLTHQYTAGLEAFQESLKGYQKLENYEYVAYCNTNIAQIYEALEDLDAAFEYNQKALALLIDINKTSSIGKIWFNLGRIHCKQQQFLLSNEAFKKCIELSEPSVQAIAQNWLGINFREAGIYDSALYYHQLSIATNDGLDQPIELARNFSNIGKIHYLQRDYQRAIDYYLRAESIQIRAPDSLSLFKLYNRLGEVYKDSGDPRNGLVYLLRGQQINVVDGAEALRNRELTRATRQLINNQVIGQGESHDKPGVIFGTRVWLLGLGLAFLVIGVILFFRRTIFGF
jgi:tetratricopeptide (TPR) repeat protein